MYAFPFLRKNAYLCIYVFLFCLCNAVSPALADQQAFIPQLQKVLDTAVAGSEATPGAVLLVSSPDLGTLAVASGVADKITDTPMRITNNFRLASMSKTYLAVVILKLSEDGLLNLDDKVADLLPDTIEVSRIPNGSKVTVRELLEMRSGIPNYLEYDAYTDKMKAEPNHRWVPQDGIEMIYDEKPNFAPGKSYEYSNTNYILLQSIIEHLTGSTLASQFTKYIFSPLHLNNTYQEIQQKQEGGFHGLKTHGYDKENGKLIDVTTLNDGFGLGDGGLVSTAQDLKTFVQSLLQTKTLLSPPLLDEMLTVIGPDNYGLGIYEEEVGGEIAWTHNGASSGFLGQYYYFPQRKLTLIILTNSFASDIVDDVAAKTLKVLNKQ